MARPSLIKEFLLFLKENKLWWMMPIFLVFGLLGMLIYFSVSNPAALPFIYTLF